MTRHAPATPPRDRRAAEREALRRHRRYVALQLMSGCGPEGLPPHADGGRNVGLLVGLESDGLAIRLKARDAIGDLRFEITDEGRQALAAAVSEQAL
jgi:hypothetical protein